MEDAVIFDRGQSGCLGTAGVFFHALIGLPRRPDRDPPWNLILKILYKAISLLFT
jgi:hypothetical protein